VGTYEAGVALGAKSADTLPPSPCPRAPQTRQSLVFGAALAVHA
jgi:hypothetical protein